MTELLNSMSQVEFGVIVICFIIGFSLISFVLKNRRQSSQSQTATAVFGKGDSWWRILEVSSDASEEEIRQAYQHHLSECEAARYLGDTSKMSVNAAVKKIPLLHHAFEEAMKQRMQEND